MMILEETMEEKPVRKTDWGGIASLCLGIVAIITSSPVWLLSMTIPCPSEEFSALCWYRGFGLILGQLSPMSGIVGLVTGFISIKTVKEKRLTAIIGVVFNAIALLLYAVLFIYFALAFIGGY
jgi:hypothetical protein